MNIVIDKNILAVAVTRVSGAIAEKNISYIGLKADQGQLTITCSDRVLAVYCNLQCEVESMGEGFVTGKLFSDIVKELPPGLVTIKKNGSFLKISAGEKSSFTMKIPLLEDLLWRDRPEFESNSAKAHVPSNKLAYMIEQVLFCIQQDSPRDYGVVGYLHKHESKHLRLVGTDGFRLSYCNIETQAAETFINKGICLSKRTLNEILRMCSEGFEIVNIAISEDNTTLKAYVDGYEIFILLSAIRYPSYQGVLPSKFEAEAQVSKPLLQAVLKRVLLAADKTKALQMSFFQNELTLTAKTMGSSESCEKIELAQPVEKEVVLTVNGKYLWETLNTMLPSELLFRFSGEGEPLMIVPLEEPDQCCSRHVLVPIRENN